MKLQKFEHDGFAIYAFFCRGCGILHAYHVRDDGRHPSWDFNGDMERPTFTPSLLCTGHRPGVVCHLYVTNGIIQYLSDCTHSLAGTTFELMDAENLFDLADEFDRTSKS